MLSNNETLLTRFMTLHLPDQVSETNKNLYFVYHPNEEESTLHDTTLAGFITKRTAFVASSPNELIAINNSLYNFAQEVWKIRKRITLADWSALKTQFSPSKLDDEVSVSENRNQVWDQYIYYATNQKSILALDVCTLFLLADHWLSNESINWY